MISRRRVIGGAAGAILLSSQLGELAAAAAKPGGTLNFGLSSYPPNLDPFVNTGTAAATAHLASYRGLVGYDATGTVRSEVAERWRAEGLKSYVFELRKNAKFQNGDPVTGDDVKFSLERIVAPDSTLYLKAQLGPVLDHVEVVGPKTVRLVLKEPCAVLLYMLATPYAPIVSKRVATANPNDLVGCGPFVLKTAEKGSKITLTRFGDYYKPGLPRLDVLNFIAYADDNLRVTALQAGDVDLIEYVPWQSMDSISKNAKLSLQTVDGPFMYLIYNTTTGPFAKAEVRQAIGFAVNRNDILQTAFFGRGSALNGMPIPSSSPLADKKLANFWSYDPEKAKKMLAAAGYPNGFSASLLSTAQYGMHKDTAVVVQENLGKIGVKVELKLPDWATRVSLGNKGQYDFAIGGSAGDFNDPDSLTTFVSGSGFYLRSFGFSDLQLDRLLNEGRATLDQRKRKDIYAQVQTEALKQAPIIGLSWRSQGYAMGRYVEGFRNLPGFLSFFSGYTLDETSLNK
jgi:peptide/nickel transport system substrate-binding protein